MKSWSELTDEEKKLITELIEKFAKIIDAYLDELVPAFEYLLNILTMESKTIRMLAEVKDNE